MTPKDRQPVRRKKAVAAPITPKGRYEYCERSDNIMLNKALVAHMNELAANGWEIIDWRYGNKTHEGDSWFILARRLVTG